jgi:hypothetical protein
MFDIAATVIVALCKLSMVDSAVDTDACAVVTSCRDSHARFFYRALQCFLFDFWSQQECQATLDSVANAQLADMPAAPGGAYCFHLLGPASGRVCMVHVVLGTSLVENPQVKCR